MDKNRILKVLQMISDDTKKDIKELEGKPFEGKVVAEQFGRQAAAIQALANIIKEHLIWSN